MMIHFNDFHLSSPSHKWIHHHRNDKLKTKEDDHHFVSIIIAWRIGVSIFQQENVAIGVLLTNYMKKKRRKYIFLVRSKMFLSIESKMKLTECFEATTYWR